MKLSLPIALLLAFPLAANAADQPAVISHVKVLSDKVEDVSSLDAIEKSIFKPGMSDADKAKALFDTVVKFRHHDSIPQEFLTSSPAVQDAVKIFNVYGYCSGLSTQPAFLQLARHAGYPARHWSIWRFGEPEIFYGNAWHLYDPAMINYFLRDDGTVASFAEVNRAVLDWHKENPGYHDKADKLKAYMKDPGIKAGPKLIANCPTLQPNGSYPLNYFGWYSTMLIYNTAEKPAFIYEEPYSEGYQVNNQLRRGEKLTFNWSNKGLHVGMLDNPDKKPESMTTQVGKGPLTYTPKYGDLANQRVGNGTLEYTPPIESLKDVAVHYENLAAISPPSDPVPPNRPILAPKDASKPAALILHMPCSYVYLAGSLQVEATFTKSSSLEIQLSDNNGLDWKPVAKFDAGTPLAPIDLQKLIGRRYDYRLKFTFTGNTALSSIKLSHDFQHSQRALPALDKGDNTITFSAGRGGRK